jgi:hypothetical protein
MNNNFFVDQKIQNRADGSEREKMDVRDVRLFAVSKTSALSKEFGNWEDRNSSVTLPIVV